MKTKRCTKCGKFSPIEKFSIAEGRKDGLRCWCKNCDSRQYKKYLDKNGKQVNQRKRIRRLKMKIEVLGHYANGPPKCDCCGELHVEFLAIDHINGGGMRHRKELGATDGRDFYYWLKKNNYPKEYRVLCHNCNFAFGAFGYCPHKSDKIKQKRTS